METVLLALILGTGIPALAQEQQWGRDNCLYTRVGNAWQPTYACRTLERGKGRPVVTQETDFSSLLPTGCGLFGFSTMEEAAVVIEEINSDFARHSRGACEIAREEMEADKVLGKLLRQAGYHCPQIPFQPWKRRWRTAA